MRSLLRSGSADVVLAYAVDRLSRSQNHVGILVDEVQQAGAHLEFVTERFEDTAVGRFILAAWAFIAEVEREKIVERTTRGKTERARSGKLPQATGAGIYGYRYDPATGQRTIDPAQGAVVQRIFAEFCRGASCHSIATALNREGRTALAGGRWYAVTVRRILLNETYTGRTVYRRTRVEQVRDPRTGRKQRRVVERERDAWIDIDGATPPLINPDTYAHAAAILADPERRRRGQPTTTYQLRGRIRCLDCGTAMVGQALSQRRYRYYRCRRSYLGSYDSTCSARYIPVDLLEDTVRSEVARVLAKPDLIIAEAEREHAGSDDHSRVTDLDRQIEETEAAQRRLVRLFTAGTIREDILTAESERLNRERQHLERERSATPPTFQSVDPAWLRANVPSACARVRSWVERANGDDFALLLSALQVEVTASSAQVEIAGSIPIQDSLCERYSEIGLATIEQTSA